MGGREGGGARDVGSVAKGRAAGEDCTKGNQGAAKVRKKGGYEENRSTRRKGQRNYKYLPGA